MRLAHIDHAGTSLDLLVHDDEYLSNQIVETGRFYESEILETLRQHFPSQRTIIDVGANIGNHATFFARVLRPKRLVCFEPVPMNFEILQRNLDAHASDLVVHAHPVALGASAGMVAMAVSPANMGGCEVVPGVPGSVEMRTLDSYDYDDVSLLKIDVENWYLDVLKGSIKTLLRSHPVVVTEGPFEEVFPILGRLGYLCTAMWNIDVRTYLYQAKPFGLSRLT
ncbi:MAG TPA: FkbM family methyltransferase [Vicinamibacterales bacterium]|jgi:FkbM family methyltransferase